MRTGLDGNGDCADATPLAVNIATAAATLRNPLPMASLPIFSLLLQSHASLPTASPPGADHSNDQDMLTIPEIASSFGALTRRPRSYRERIIVAGEGRIQWRRPRAKHRP